MPLRAGSLLPGNENDAQAYREAHLVERLREAGCSVVDDGDVAIPSYLPHHSIPPIRNWPASVYRVGVCGATGWGRCWGRRGRFRC